MNSLYTGPKGFSYPKAVVTDNLLLEKKATQTPSNFIPSDCIAQKFYLERVIPHVVKTGLLSKF